MLSIKKNFASVGAVSRKTQARHIGKRAYSVFRIIILLAIGFVILYPLFYMISTSLRSRASFMNSVRVWLPEKLDALTNYRVALKALHYKEGLISSLKYEVLSADRKELIREISHRVTSIKVLVREMTEARKVANHKDNYKERAFEYEEKVRPYLDKIRDHIDHLEMEVDDEIWPLPKYRELLFTK